MLIVISPAKKLDYSGPCSCSDFTNPLFLKQTRFLVGLMKKKTTSDIAKLMNLSDSLAKLNKERFNNFKTPFKKGSARQAIYAFKGDVYRGLEIERFSKRDIEYTQNHLRILSGLYGLLSPLDLMMPYRLEMGTKLKIRDKSNLYHYWQDLITKEIDNQLNAGKHTALINLASKEYSQAIDFTKLKKPIITPVFKQKQKGVYKIIGIFAKKARGMMTAHILLNKIKSIDSIKTFKEDGYRFHKNLSTDNEWVFCRDGK